MSEVKTIKDISDETWVEFKDLAAKHNVKLAEFFRVLVEEHEKKDFWAEVLEGRKILSEKEAEELEKVIVSVRKEYGFRT